MVPQRPMWGALALITVAVLWIAVPSALHGVRLQPDDNQYKCAEDDPTYTGDKKRPSTPPVVISVELTDDGELVDRCELTDVFDELVKKRPSDSPESTIAVLYIHGWKHDSESEDRENFESLIAELTNREATKPLGSRRHVVGVYVSWDASFATTFPILENLTFWSRKRAADRIAQSGIVAKMVGAIENIQHITDRCSKQSWVHCKNRTILMGHSFGARILYSATAPLYLHELQLAHPGPKWNRPKAQKKRGRYKCINGPADAVILVNPAMEASVYTALHSVRRNEEAFHPKQQPKLFVISTTNDVATSLAFPFGQYFGFIRGERNVTTIGNYDEYRTHLLTLPGENTPKNENVETVWSDNFCDSELCLSVDTNADLEIPVQERNPFVVAQTTEDIIDGHNGHWGPEFRQWKLSLIDKLDRELDGKQPESCLARRPRP